ncbi:MAG: alternative ribosome rescue aminoacyl-tRNA hydrolase ArfB [Gammaproteobacteria bacterium]|nr:alternative ribosome rescue aminoacyl-tRNA hydrolase ArfB [Gammaproteobacteria bacterium]
MYFPSHPAIPNNALSWQFTQARGPGGQHVNKVATAVSLRVSVDALHVKPEVRQRMMELALVSNVNDREIVIRSSAQRSQWQNRIAAWNRLLSLLDEASRTPKARVRTKPTVASKRKRLNLKRRQALTKANRRRPTLD